MITVLGSQPAGDVSHKPGGGCHYFPPGPQLPPQPLRGLLPILLLGKQRHNECEQFAWDRYPTTLRLRFEPGPFCAWVQHGNHSATEPPDSLYNLFFQLLKKTYSLYNRQFIRLLLLLLLLLLLSSICPNNTTVQKVHLCNCKLEDRKVWFIHWQLPLKNVGL